MTTHLDLAFYKTMYPDLAQYSDDFLQYHFTTYGSKELRFCCMQCFNKHYPDFTPEEYAKFNPDLATKNNAELLTHFISRGRFEYRKHKCHHSARDFPYLFHKYDLGIAQSDKAIPIVVLHEAEKAFEPLCHFHMLDPASNMDTYKDMLLMLSKSMHVVVTVCSKHMVSAPYVVPQELKCATFLEVFNKGYDIGGKVAFMDYAIERNLVAPDSAILFLHSKSDPHKRNRYFVPLARDAKRVAQCLALMKSGLDGIFPDCLWINHKDGFVYNGQQVQDFLSYLGFRSGHEVTEYAEGNCMYLSGRIVNWVFKGRTREIYNNLNEGNSFDLNWVRSRHPNLLHMSPRKLYAMYANGDIPYGCNNPIMETRTSYPDAMFEHAFERIWIEILKQTGKKYVALDSRPIAEQFNLRLNALYFPQYHPTPENDRFWGEGFTEWTLLRPYPNTVRLNNQEQPIQKPHDDIGYYDMSDVKTIQKQIKIARDHLVNGFVIYHYWFHGQLEKDEPKVLYKPLEFFLSNEVTFPFAISWANETWSRRWDGSEKDILLKQVPGTEAGWRKHIRYLIPFFQRPNYMKNERGECIFYIYLLIELGGKLDPMLEIWQQELDKHGLKIQVICTVGHNPANNTVTSTRNDVFVFQPMYNFTKTKNTSQAEQRRNPRNYTYVRYDFDNLVKDYIKEDFGTKNVHFGACLGWNNCIRRKDLTYYAMDGCTPEKFEREVLDIVTKAIRHGGYSKATAKFIVVNAWNEWNEQATLEPSNVNGYQYLEAVRSALLA